MVPIVVVAEDGVTSQRYYVAGTYTATLHHLSAPGLVHVIRLS